MNNVFCQELKFERDLLNLIKTDSWEKLKNLLLENKNMFYDPNAIDLKKIFIMLGRKDIDGLTKHSVLEQFLNCVDFFPVFDDRLISNKVIIESVRNNLEVIDQTIEKYGCLDCKVDDIDYSYWLYINNHMEILSKYLYYFNEEIPWLIFKFSRLGIYENEFILYLKSKLFKTVKLESSPKLIQIIFFTEYGVCAVIDKEEILRLEINDQQIESFLLSRENYIFKIKLRVNRDLKDDENIFEEFNDIVAIKVITENSEYIYKLPLFFETKYGINYLQRYKYENSEGVFEYDYTSLSNDVFIQEEFEAKIKTLLDINLNKKLNNEDLLKIENLNLIFDEDIKFYDFEKTLKDLNKLKKLKILQFDFIGYEKNLVLDTNKLIQLDELQVIRVISSENINILNLQHFNKKQIDIKLNASEFDNSLEIIFDNFVENKIKFIEKN